MDGPLELSDRWPSGNRNDGGAGLNDQDAEPRLLLDRRWFGR